MRKLLMLKVLFLCTFVCGQEYPGEIASNDNLTQQQSPAADSLVMSYPKFRNEVDSSRMQAGVSGVWLPAYLQTWVLFEAELNIPSRKYGWFHSISAYATTTTRASNNYSRYYSALYGKKLELVKRHSYFAIGIGLGAFHNRTVLPYKRETVYGLSVSPHIEAGFDFKHLTVAAGMYFSMNFGRYTAVYSEDYQYLEMVRTSGGRAIPLASPYIKILLK